MRNNEYISREEKHGITQKLLKEYFEYKDGKLYWLVKLNFKINIGSEAGSLHSNGYVYIQIDKKIYRRSRLVFLFHKGYLSYMVDHKRYGKI